MKQIQKNSFICYIIYDQAWWCNVKRFLSYSKNHICRFMQVNLWHHKLFHFHMSFPIWKVWKGTKKLHKFEYLENKKNFLDEIKYIFHTFQRASIWWKNKKLIKNNGYRLYLCRRDGGKVLQIFQKKFIVQKTIDLNISWPSKFFRKHFFTSPINFSFLFRAFL